MGLRAAGYKIVPVSELVGQTRAQVMPEVTGKELWAARADSYIFGFMFLARVGIATVFILGIHAGQRTRNYYWPARAHRKNARRSRRSSGI